MPPHCRFQEHGGLLCISAGRRVGSSGRGSWDTVEVQQGNGRGSEPRNGPQKPAGRAGTLPPARIWASGNTGQWHEAADAPQVEALARTMVGDQDSPEVRLCLRAQGTLEASGPCSPGVSHSIAWGCPPPEPTRNSHFKGKIRAAHPADFGLGARTSPSATPPSAGARETHLFCPQS